MNTPKEGFSASSRSRVYFPDVPILFPNASSSSADLFMSLYRMTLDPSSPAVSASQ